MSAANIHNYVVADATTSTFDQVKHTVINTGNWIGRQVQWIAGSLKDIFMRIFEAVKPFFATVVQFAQDQSAKVKEFIVANKEVSVAVGVAIPLVAMLTLGSYWLFCGTEAKAPAK